MNRDHDCSLLAQAELMWNQPPAKSSNGVIRSADEGNPGRHAPKRPTTDRL